jgi:hypothetical protein
MIQDLIRWDAARYQVHVTDIELVRDFVRLAQTVTRYGGDHESGASWVTTAPPPRLPRGLQLGERLPPCGDRAVAMTAAFL